MSPHPIARALARLVRPRRAGPDGNTVAEITAKLELTLASLPVLQRAQFRDDGERAVADVLAQVAKRAGSAHALRRTIEMGRDSAQVTPAGDSTRSDHAYTASACPTEGLHVEP
jgi:hypothetical protein